MALTPEGKVVSAINRFLKKNGWFQINMMQTNVNGLPDRLIYKDGRYIWFEIKAENGAPSPIQKYVIEKMKGLGMEVYLVYSLNELKEKINGKKSDC